MTFAAQLLAQRSSGSVHLRMEQHGIAALREDGSAKCRLPRGSSDAVLINTSGGLAGGDRLAISAEAGDGATLTLTTQAAERVYRTLGPAAEVRVSLTAGRNARLSWLPQDTIFFDGSALTRSLDVELAPDAEFLAVESLAFGRQEMGECVRRISVSDRWQVRRAGRLMHMEAFRVDPDWPTTVASFGECRAMATLLHISPDAESKLERVRAALGPHDGASAWNGKLIARLLARDAFELRKVMIPALKHCVGSRGLPKLWTL